MQMRRLLVLAVLFFVASPINAQRKVAEDARTSVPAKINERFMQEDFNAESMMKRWEIESREIYAYRNEVVKALKLSPGESIADVGAGTGLFVAPFAKAVGKDGTVFAVDISPRFIDLIKKRVKQEKLANVEAVLSKHDSTELSENCVDVVFVCDTYHHFEYHVAMLRSISSALRPGGELAIIDFERIPGKTSKFLMEHVRAGKEVFRKEIEDAGFEFIEEVKIDGFKENYFLRFKKK